MTMILNVITLLFIVINSTKCSIVHDVVDQELNYVSKFCPQQKYCREGTHVVCMYYHHNQKFGPRCGNPINIEFTPTMIQHVLANVNDIRGKVATGMETGKDGEFLPRAYGLMKLEWDRELAIFAQVLANQCLGGKEDICRATNRFPNPSQTIVLIRYKYPNWDYMRQNSNDTRNGLNEEKLMFALGRFIKTTHALKRTATRDIITSCPHFYELPDVNLKFYLNLIRGGATHIGCGVSAYSDNNMYIENGSKLNRVEVVCNISEAPRPRQPVYKIVPPVTGRGYSTRCGCPRGYKESRNCLCEKDKKLWKGRNVAKPTDNSIQSPYNMHKDKVKLRSPLWPRRKHLKNQLLENFEHESKNIENETYNYGLNDEVILPAKSQLPKIQASPEIVDAQINGIESPRVFSKSRNNIVFKAKNNEDSDENIMKSINYTKELTKIKKAITPKIKKKHSKFTNEKNQLARRYSRHPMLLPTDLKEVVKPATSVKGIGDLIFKVRRYVKDEATTASTLDVVEETIVDHYEHFKENNDDSNEKVVQRREHNKYSDFSEKRLLYILNSLEQEVSKIKFDEDLKRLFYSKMRKIYATGLMKPEETPSLDALAKQLDVYKKDLNELREYLKNEKGVAIGDDEIPKHEQMIHSLPTETKTDNKLTYIENENTQNQNNKYMDNDEYLEIKHFNNMAYPYIPSKTALAEYQNLHNIKYIDSPNDNPKIDQQHDVNIEPQDNIEMINLEVFPPAPSNVRETILSRAIEYNNLDNYDDEKVELEQTTINENVNNKKNVISGIHRRIDKNKGVNSSGRSTSTFQDSETQFNIPYNPMNQYEQTQMKIDPPRPSMYSSDTEVMI